jgi:hypothetical protein
VSCFDRFLTSVFARAPNAYWPSYVSSPGLFPTPSSDDKNPNEQVHKAKGPAAAPAAGYIALTVF